MSCNKVLYSSVSVTEGEVRKFAHIAVSCRQYEDGKYILVDSKVN